MDMMPVKPERKAQLEEYARLHDQSPEEALDDLLAGYFDTDQEEYDETVKAVAEAYEDVNAGRTYPAEQVLEELRVKHGFPR
jgi:hypothetical protein